LAFVEIRNLCRSYGDFSLTDISLELDRGKTLTLMGQSGSGKTSLLRSIAGFDIPDSGTIHLNGTDITEMPVSSRKVGMIFQELALFPNMSVFDNIAYGLRSRRMAESEIRQIVKELASSLHIDSLLLKRPFQLSMGERQRAALARSVAVSPLLLLLDEPFSSVDSQLRVELRSELKGFASEFGLTMIFVTHDSREGFFMGDIVCLIREGQIMRKGLPADVFNNPGTEEAAKLLGYNVMKVDGRKIAFLPSRAHLSTGGGIPVRVVSAGYEGELTRVVVRTDAFETVNVYSTSGHSSFRQADILSLSIEDFVTLE
jgi:ABC-type Fe3+/spermidine/putrescine transport system ATPase subunit